MFVIQRKKVLNRGGAVNKFEERRKGVRSKIVAGD